MILKFLRNLLLLWLLLLIPDKDNRAQDIPSDKNYVYYVADPAKQRIVCFWKDEHKQGLRSLKNLLGYTTRTHQTLLFAMNGGMFTPDWAPQGLYIEEGKEWKAMDRNHGSGNFYWKPNGVFAIDIQGKAMLSTSETFVGKDIQYATQSGPMLVLNGRIHPEFKKESTKVNLRNGVGILPNGKVLFAMSKVPVNFYDFASFFLKRGCTQALYLDGFVSRCYAPSEHWIQEDGDFGVMIGVLQKPLEKTLKRK